MFFGLQDSGAFTTPYSMKAIAHGGLCPPSTTRAAVRGRIIEKFGHAVESTQWDHVTVCGAQKKIELDLRNLFDRQLVKKSLQLISAARSVEDLPALKFARLV